MAANSVGKARCPVARATGHEVGLAERGSPRRRGRQVGRSRLAHGVVAERGLDHVLEDAPRLGDRAAQPAREAALEARVEAAGGAKERDPARAQAQLARAAIAAPAERRVATASRQRHFEGFS